MRGWRVRLFLAALPLLGLAGCATHAAPPPTPVVRRLVPEIPWGSSHEKALMILECAGFENHECMGHGAHHKWIFYQWPKPGALLDVEGIVYLSYEPIYWK